MAIEWGCGCGVRHIQMLLLVACGMIEGSMLQSMKISIFLVDREGTSNYTLFDDPYRQAIRHFTNQQKTVLINGWLVMGFAGSLICGYLTLFVNLKYLLLGIIGSITAITYLTPLIVVNTSYDVVLSTILITGLFHGMMDPVIIALLARWIPRGELGRIVSAVFSAPILTTVMSILLFAFLRESPSSWSSIFYLTGNSGVLWCVSWYAFGYPDPNKCFYVSIKEKTMINKNVIISNNNKKLNVPWPTLFKSVPFYGLLISRTLSSWIFRLVFLTNFSQSYMFAREFPYSIQIYGIIGFVLLMILIVEFLAGTVGDNLIVKKNCPSRYVRKTFNSIALWGECVCCLLLSYKTSPIFDLAIIGVFHYVGCLIFQGSYCNFFDVDRRLSGFICGLVNFVSWIPLAYVSNFSFPILKALGPNIFESTWKTSYDTVWITGAFTCFIGNFFYIIMATDETDPMLPLPTSEPVAGKT